MPKRLNGRQRTAQTNAPAALLNAINVVDQAVPPPANWRPKNLFEAQIWDEITSIRLPTEWNPADLLIVIDIVRCASQADQIYTHIEANGGFSAPANKDQVKLWSLLLRDRNSLYRVIAINRSEAEGRALGGQAALLGRAREIKQTSRDADFL